MGRCSSRARRERLVAPGVPVHRVVRVLAQVRRRLGGEAVGAAGRVHESGLRVRGCSCDVHCSESRRPRGVEIVTSLRRRRRDPCEATPARRTTRSLHVPRFTESPHRPPDARGHRCTTGTKFVNTWKAARRRAASVKQGDLVIAMVMSKEETTRSDRRGPPAARSSGSEASAPFHRSPSSPRDQVDRLGESAAAIQDSGAVALVSMRPIAVNKQQTYVPAHVHGRRGRTAAWGPYYGYGWSVRPTARATW